MNSDKRNYDFADSVLYSNGDLILAACATYPAIPARLPADYITQTTDFLSRARLATVAKSRNITELSDLTEDQNDAMKKIEELNGLARKLAATAFRGQETKLSEQFGVGEKPRNLAELVALAIKIHGGCTDPDNAPGMTAKGWTTAENDELQAAILTLTGADTIQEARKGANKGDTASRIQLNNEVYDHLLTIQNASRVALRADTPENIAARTAFRWGLFPPVRPQNRPPTIPRKFVARPGDPGSQTLNLDWNISNRGKTYQGAVTNKLTGEVITTFTTEDNKHTLVLTTTPAGTEVQLTLTALNDAGATKPTRPITATVP